jgi:hypothetical protein
MGPVMVEIAATPATGGEEVAFIDDVDRISSAEVMLGCGDDNPY